MGPLPWAKAAAQVIFDWDIECTAPRATRHNRSWIAELATCSILGNVVGHRMEAMRGLCLVSTVPAHTAHAAHAAPACWAAKQLLLDTV